MSAPAGKSLNGTISRVAVITLGLLLAAEGPGLRPPSRTDPPDFSAPGQAWNVLPPGESGSPSPGVHSVDQVALYDGLTPLFDQVTDADLARFFKPNVFGLGGEPPAGVEESQARPDLRIDRDSKGVAPVLGTSRDDVMHGTGWVTAEDRTLVMDLFRGAGRLAAVDAPGIDPVQIVPSLRQFIPSPQTEACLAEQSARLAGLGPAGLRSSGTSTSTSPATTTHVPQPA